MAIKLYPHQEKALDKLENGSLLCGGVGSGKSITAVAYYHNKVCGGEIPRHGKGKIKKRKKKIPLYIITTAKKRDSLDWVGECNPFLVEPIVDSWNNIKKYVKVKNAFFIFDEQRVVGYGAWTKSFIKIAKHNKWILLTATPGDTWIDYIPVFIANGFYKNKTAFTREHIVYSRFVSYPKVERFLSTKKLEKQRDSIIVKMYFERETIPNHIEVKVPYDRKLEKKVMKDRWNIYKDKPVVNAGELCYLLRRVVNSDPERVKQVLKLLSRHPKVIIFYNFNYELEILRDMMSGLDIPMAEWNGHKHEEIPKGERWVYLVQYTAGAEGWNCIETDTIIFFSQNYSYKVMIQAAGRIDRINTKFTNLYYYHFRSSSKIDIAISRALKNKKNFNARVFDSKTRSRE